MTEKIQTAQTGIDNSGVEYTTAAVIESDSD